MHAYSARYDAALTLAAQAHRDQLRKGTATPYIVHVVHVATILQQHGCSEDLVVAGLLHDVIEDCGLTLESLAAAFGPRVANLVAAVSERKTADGTELPWEQRKAEKLAALRNSGPDVALLKAADAVHNARSLSADLQSSGAAVWARFKRGPAQTLGYYHGIREVVQAHLGDHPLALELAAAVAELEAVSQATAAQPLT